MNMHATARQLAERLGHECRLQAVATCNGLDQTFQQKGMVGSDHGVINVVKVHFKLPRRILRHCGIGRQILRRCRAGKLLHQVLEIRQHIHAVKLDLRVTLAGSGRGRRAGHPLHRALGVEKVEFQLTRHAGAQPDRAQPGIDGGQQMARVGEKGRAVGVEHGHQGLGGRPPRPRDRCQRCIHDPAHMVGIANAPQQAGAVNGGAGDVQGEHRSRKGQAMRRDLAEALARNTFATRNAVQIGKKDLHRPNIGMCTQKSFDRLCALRHLPTPK